MIEGIARRFSVSDVRTEFKNHRNMLLCITEVTYDDIRPYRKVFSSAKHFNGVIFVYERLGRLIRPWEELCQNFAK